MAATSGDRDPRTERPTDGELPLDVVYGLLSNRRRRIVLRYLRAEPGASTVSDLAEHVASVETGKSVAALTAAERKRAYVALYQSHLPKLDDAGVVDYDGRDAVELTDTAIEVEAYLPPGDDATGESRENDTAAFLAAGGVGAVGSLGAVGLGAGWGAALAVLLSTAVAFALWWPLEPVG